MNKQDYITDEEYKQIEQIKYKGGLKWQQQFIEDVEEKLSGLK